MRLKAAPEHLRHIQVVECFLRIRPAQGAFQHPVVLDAEDFDAGPGDGLIQPRAQIAGDLLPFVDDLQPGRAPPGLQLVDLPGDGRPISPQGLQLLEPGHRIFP